MRVFLKTAFILIFLSNLTYAKNINREVSFQCRWQVACTNPIINFGTSILQQKIKLDYKPKWITFTTEDFKCKFPNQKPIKINPTLEYYQVVEIINGEKCDFAVLIQKEDMAHTTRQKFYQNSKEGVIESRTEVSTKDIKIDGLDAVEIQYKTDKRTTRAFYVLNKKMNTIVLIMVVGEKSTINKNFVDRFVASFKIK